MQYDQEEHELVFETTGKMIYANCGIIGIDHKLQPHEGYDGCVHDNELTPLERVELAAYAIELWGKYQSKAYFEHLAQSEVGINPEKDPTSTDDTTGDTQ